MLKLIVVDGPDCVGKSTLIKGLIEKYKNVDILKILEFPKTIDGVNPLKIESVEEVAIFESMLKYFDPGYIYILDRSYLSNYVYESLRAGKIQTRYLNDAKRLFNQHSTLIIPLNTSEIDYDYSDDLINLTANNYNKVISLYDKAYDELSEIIPIEFKGGISIIRQDNNGFKPNEENTKIVFSVIDKHIKKFMFETFNLK